MFIDSESLETRLRITSKTLDDLKWTRSEDRQSSNDRESIEEIEGIPLPSNEELSIVSLRKRGRPVGYQNKTEAERTLIGLESRILGQTSAAKLNGVSQSFAGLCEKGKANTNGATPVNEVRKERVDSEVNKIRSEAMEGLKTSISVLNGKLSEDMKTNDAIGIASTLVKIVNIATPDEKRDQASRLIIMAPQVREERLYETIDLN